MELKEFIKQALRDITDAVKESKEELKNGAILAPTNVSNSAMKISSKDGDLVVSQVDFDIAVEATSESEAGHGGKAGISVWGIELGINSGVNGKSNESNTSRIKFSIPLVLPPTLVEKRSSVTIKHHG